MHRLDRQKHLLNVRMLMRTIGWLLLIESVFMLVPMITALCYDEDDWLVFLISLLLTAASGTLLATRRSPASRLMGKRDGYILTALVWVVFSLFGMLPFMLGSLSIGFTDAFFEAMSGFTTTGATVLAQTGQLTHGVHIWRAMMQWTGGMGIILFTIAVIPMLNHSGGMQMFNAEVTGVTHEKIQPRISQTAKTLWLIYFGLTVILVMLLWAGPQDLFTSVCHAFGTISTGGYSILDNIDLRWQNSNYIKIVLTVFMFLGGVNFGLIFRALRGKPSLLWRNEVFRVFIGVILVAYVLYAISIFFTGAYTGWESLTIDPLFQVVSICTSTGFTLDGFDSWGGFVLAITFVLMFFGGCAGSTSGGAKIDRIIYLFKNSRNELYRCLYPNSVLSVKVGTKVSSPELVSKVIAFLCMYMLLVVGGGIALTLCGVPVVESFFSAFSCVSNTGLDAAITGYGSAYAFMPDAAKWILSFLMLTGRLEIFTILVLFLPSFWQR